MPGSTTQGRRTACARWLHRSERRRGGGPAPAEVETKGKRAEEIRVLIGFLFSRWVGEEEGRTGVVDIGA